MLDIPVISEGSIGVFDHLPAAALSDPDAFAAKLVTQLRSACAEAHGAAYIAWLRILVADPQRALEAVRKGIDLFMCAAKFDRDDSYQARHARHFALIYAAGAYAIERKLLPWSAKKFGAATHKCHQAANRRLIEAMGNLADGLARFGARVAEMQRFADWPVRGLPDLSANNDGWRKRVGSTQKLIIRGDSFRSWFSSAQQVRQVLKHLRVSGAASLNGTTSIRARDGKKQRKIRCYRIDPSKAV